MNGYYDARKKEYLKNVLLSINFSSYRKQSLYKPDYNTVSSI